MTIVAQSLKDRLPATIRTARLVLATPTLAHVPDMAVLANNKAIHAMLSRLPHPYGQSDGRDFVENIARGDTEFAWAIEWDGAFIGTVGLHILPEKLPELGYWLGEPFWGKGFATEAANAVVAAARAAGATALRSRALKHNIASRNVLKKAGFVETGEAIEPDHNLAGKTMTLMRLEFDPR
ncbi:RimJ/RimL family protein N-acetyltransferase [Devosia subaequoris]|uniref:RimJ/RimL family protein N-acetyltransferase n=1 Tax=Devosia subaequoris TaxID=395930 RepID=A0A7W6IMT6_9HYPH|nr:GNAT family N-acetyltransferase [Devosia subaequoris]MBB4052505.1 RimJ/RimL family protein N-acetyltransferase [Devosia subaequoris]MCP1209664.1 GNAT family N-acetyltransferase [Devosia subaequoris]